MHGPTLVPAGVNRREFGDAIAVRRLVATKELLANRAVLADVRVLAVGVAVPDIYVGAGQRCAA